MVIVTPLVVHVRVASNVSAVKSAQVPVATIVPVEFFSTDVICHVPSIPASPVIITSSLWFEPDV